MSRLLIVDDEPTLLQLLRRYLERQGHQVETCESGEAALVISTGVGDFDLLITDLTLPGINGAELIARMRATQPALPALIASGYPYVPQLPGVRFLQKPFLPNMLAEEISKILAR